MSELATRARKLANEFVTWAATDTPMDDLAEQHISLVIEQALLAERRLAKLEDAELVEARRDPDCICDACDECMAIAETLRAAAEKEVGTK